MGFLFSKLLNLFSNEEHKIIIVGMVKILLILIDYCKPLFFSAALIFSFDLSLSAAFNNILTSKFFLIIIGVEGGVHL